MMRVRLSSRLFVAVLLCLSGGAASAHDIGVTQAELIELEAATYRLSARIGASSGSLHGGPRLPEGCSFLGSPRGVQSRITRVWEFVCERRLSPDAVIVLPWRRDAAMVSATWLDGSSGRRLFGYDNGVISVPLVELQVGSSSFGDAAGRYTLLGIEHILEGIDHLLFVLGLLLIITQSGFQNMTLIKTISAFTLAHSLTLGLATLGVIDVPARPVEAAIALSIVFLAMEVVRGWRSQLSLTHRQPWLVAFGFGLLHGLGFAGALADVGLPAVEIPVALLFFNVGVEIGQLIFVGLVLVGQMLLTRLPLVWPGWARYVPVYFIGTIGAYWILERVMAMTAPAMTGPL